MYTIILLYVPFLVLEVISGDHGDYSQVLMQKSKNGLSQRWRNEILYSAKNGKTVTPF